MAKRSISDEEIALIKAMLAAGMKNSEILFYFNKKTRPVNGGRISQIKDGSYSDSSSIAAASEAELKDFFKKHEASTQVREKTDREKLTDRIQSMFEQQPDGRWKFLEDESDVIECKESFHPRGIEKWGKAVAGLANNSGGLILFGVRDPSDRNAQVQFFELVGLDPDRFTGTDIGDVVTQLKSAFDPTPVVTKLTVQIGGKLVGCLRVDVAEGRPVMASRTIGQIRESDIFYRYPGQTTRIKHSDLRVLFDKRDEEARQKIIPLFMELAKVGPENALLADMTSGEVLSSDRRLLLDEDFLKAVKAVNTSDGPDVVISGDVHQRAGKGPIAIQTRNLFQEYPFSATQAKIEIQKVATSANQQQVWKVLGEMKGNKEYSAYNFRNKGQEHQYLKTGTVDSTVPVIYNQAAIDEAISRLIDIPEEDQP